MEQAFNRTPSSTGSPSVPMTMALPRSASRMLGAELGALFHLDASDASCWICRTRPRRGSISSRLRIRN